jgi:hypothetical protein
MDKKKKGRTRLKMKATALCQDKAQRLALAVILTKTPIWIDKSSYTKRFDSPFDYFYLGKQR